VPQPHDQPGDRSRSNHPHDALVVSQQRYRRPQRQENGEHVNARGKPVRPPDVIAEEHGQIEYHADDRRGDCRQRRGNLQVIARAFDDRPTNEDEQK